MPKYYCDYCDVFLTHDSQAGRKQHNHGRRHQENVRQFYAQFLAGHVQAPGSTPYSMNFVPLPHGSAPPGGSVALPGGALMVRPGMPGMPVVVARPPGPGGMGGPVMMRPGMPFPGMMPGMQMMMMRPPGGPGQLQQGPGGPGGPLGRPPMPGGPPQGGPGGHMQGPMGGQGGPMGGQGGPMGGQGGPMQGNHMGPATMHMPVHFGMMQGRPGMPPGGGPLMMHQMQNQMQQAH